MRTSPLPLSLIPLRHLSFSNLTRTQTPLCTVGISVLQIPEADCLLTIYKGTQTCTDPNEIVSYAIQKGEGGMVCIDVGVFHSCAGISAGGRGGASGVWSCG